MSSDPDKSRVEPISRKRATLLLALGGYLNTGIQIVQGLLLVPLYLHFIGPRLYGLWLATGGILAMLGVMNLGLGSLLIQRVAQAYGQNDLPRAGSYFINGLVVYLMLALAFIGVGLLLSFNLSALLKETGADEALLRQCFQVALLAAGLGFVNECLRGFAYALLRPLFSTLALAGARIVGLVASFILLYQEWGLWAIPLGMLLTEGLVLLFGLMQAVTLFRGLGARWVLSLEQVRDYFKSGGMLFASRLGHALSRDADPLLITLFLRPEITAAYMVTRKAADIVFQLLGVVYGAAHGAFSHLAGAGNDARTGAVAAKLLALVFFAGLVGFACYVALNTAFIGLWVGNAFALDQSVIMLIGAAYFLNSLRNMALQIHNGLGEFNYTSRLVLLEGLAKTGLTALLLSWMGIAGVPLALGAGCAVILVVFGMKLRERISLNFAPRIYGVAALTSVGVFGLATILSQNMAIDSWWQFVIFATGCVLAAMSMTIFFNRDAFKMLLKANP